MNLVELITDDTKKLSASRVILFVLVSAYIVYASYIVYTSKQIPDIPLNLAGMMTLLYGANKFSKSNG